MWGGEWEEGNGGTGAQGRKGLTGAHILWEVTIGSHRRWGPAQEGEPSHLTYPQCSPGPECAWGSMPPAAGRSCSPADGYLQGSVDLCGCAAVKQGT